MSEKRYIDVDLLNKKLDSFDTEATCTEYNCGYSDCLTAVQDTISDIPTVDIVHCKDCRHWDNVKFQNGETIKTNYGECKCSQWCNDFFWYNTVGNAFCSYGERKILK